MLMMCRVYIPLILPVGSCELFLSRMGRGTPRLESYHEYMSWTEVRH